MKHSYFHRKRSSRRIALFFTILSLFVYLQNIKGQELLNEYQATLPHFYPQTPNVAALMKHVQIPVDKSTGVTSVEIPIHEIQAGTISLPIRLLYHASGIKVNEIASSVGLGWSLDAGGMITQKIIGKPDICRENMYAPYTAQQIQGYLDEAILDPHMTNDYLWNDKISRVIDYMELYDFTNDRYMFKAGNFSGVFRQEFPHLSGSFYTIPYSRVKINKIPGHFNNGFEVIDAQGNTYIFNDKELNYVNSTCFFVWHLSEIVSADKKNRITFHYATRQLEYNLSYSDGYILYGCEAKGEYDPGNPTSPQSYCLTFYSLSPSGQYIQNIVSNSHVPLHLSSIEVNGEKRVEFHYLEDRQDVARIRLCNISVFTDGMTTEFDLKHSYSGKDNLALEENQYKLRMMLDTVELNKGASGRYTFKYNPLPLPPIYGLGNNNNLFSEDFWGYYNGQNNTTNVPKVPIESVGYGFQNHPRFAIRTPSEEHTKACILEEVTYPTGGRTRFEYESNITDNQEITGGLRIKKIVDYSEGIEISGIREYEYSKAISTDFLFKDTGTFYSNNVFISPEDAHFYTNEFIVNSIGQCPLHARYGVYKVLSHPLINLIVTNGVSIAYGTVKEKQKDKFDNDVSVTEYIHQLHDIQYQYEIYDEFQPPYENKVPHMVDRGVYTPTLLVKNEYKVEGNHLNLVRKEEYSYVPLVKGEKITGVSCNLTHQYQAPGIYKQSTTSLIISGMYSLYRYVERMEVQDTKAILDVEQLSQKTVSEYSSEGTIVSTEKYTYDPNSLQMRSIERSGSDGSTLRETFTYPSDYRSQIVYEEMDSRNIIYPVIRRELYRDNSFLKGIYTGYRKWYDSVYAAETIQVQENQYSPETRIIYHERDAYGNPIYITKDNTTRIVCIWGYGGRYLVAEIQNATYTQVKTALGNIGPETLSAAATPNFTQLNALRNHSSLESALVTTYKYRPLVGLSSMTDPSGRTTSYHYDAFGRLESIRDEAGNLIEKYAYNYKN